MDTRWDQIDGARPLAFGHDWTFAGRCRRSSPELGLQGRKGSADSAVEGSTERHSDTPRHRRGRDCSEEKGFTAGQMNAISAKAISVGSLASYIAIRVSSDRGIGGREVGPGLWDSATPRTLRGPAGG